MTGEHGGSRILLGPSGWHPDPATEQLRWEEAREICFPQPHASLGSSKPVACPTLSVPFGSADLCTPQASSPGVVWAPAHGPLSAASLAGARSLRLLTASGRGVGYVIVGGTSGLARL